MIRNVAWSISSVTLWAVLTTGRNASRHSPTLPSISKTIMRMCNSLSVYSRPDLKPLQGKGLRQIKI